MLDAAAAAKAPEQNAAPRTSRWRRWRGLAMALGGAALAAVYGYLFLDMRPGPPLVIVGLGGLTLVLCGRALWRVIDPLTGGEVAAASTDAGPRTPHRLRELEREKQAVLKAIKEIELDYQMRKLDESDYREMVERYRARALRILSELAVGDNYRELIEREVRDRLAARAARPADAGAGAAEATATAATTGAAAGAPTCAACGTVNDADAGFCKRCGGKLGV